MNAFRSAVYYALAFLVLRAHGAAWTPFFEPAVSREQLLQQLGTRVEARRRIGAGGDAQIVAVVRRTSRGIRFVSRRIHHVIDEQGGPLVDKRGFDQLHALYAQGSLGELKPVRVLRVGRTSLDVEFVEGQSLAKLFKGNYPSEHVFKLYERYYQAVHAAVMALSEGPYRADVYAGLTPTEAREISPCAFFLKHDVHTYPYVDFYRASDDRHIELMIDADNIVVDARTGEFFIIDAK